MNRALWLLLALQLRGWGRTVARSMRTAKGILLSVLGLCVLLPWLWTLLFVPRSGGADPDDLRRWGPTFFLIYCVGTVLFSRGERAVYFTPAEVNFLFAGPFSRRQLLGFKIVTGLLVGLPSTLILTLALHPNARWFLAAYVALFLSFFFLQMFTVVIHLAAVYVGTQAYTQGRKLLVLALGMFLVGVLIQAGRPEGDGGLYELLLRMERSPLWQTIVTPLVWFVEVFVTERGDWATLGKYAVLALAVDLLLVVLAFVLDAHYLEAAATTSERIYTQIQRMRSGDAVTLGGWQGGEKKARFGLPTLPWWGGIGPVAWRQLTTAFRSLGRLALLALIIGPGLVGPILASGMSPDPHGPALILGLVLFFLTVILTTVVPFDYRGDLDRMEVLKTLPLAAWRLSVGQLLTPVLIVAVVQSLVLLAAQAAWGRWDPVLLTGLAFIVPVNFLVFGLDNLLFLWFPSRMLGATPGDFQALGRNVLFLFVKSIVLAVAGGVAGGLGMLVLLLTRQPWALGITVWLVLVGCSAALLPLLSAAFHAFDVARDTPPD